MTMLLAATSPDRNGAQSPAQVLPEVNQRIWFLDVLRGIAALMVMYAHLGESFWARNSVIVTLFFSKPIPDAVCKIQPVTLWLDMHNISDAAVGVGLFFLVSGFVIAFSLSRKSSIAFLIARIFRLYPTYACAMTITCLVQALNCWWLKQAFPYTIAQILASVSMFRDCFWQVPVDSIVWTLEIEVKFYLLCALLGTRLLRNKTVIALLALCLAAATLWSVCPSVLASSDILLTRLRILVGLDCPRLLFMLLGVTIYQYWCKNWSRRDSVVVAGLLLILFVSSINVLLQTSLTERMSIASYSLAFFVFLAAYGFRNQIPKWPLFQFFANISYPLYLVHPVFGYVLMGALFTLVPIPWICTAVAFASVIYTAWVLHCYVEKPSQKLGHKFAKSYDCAVLAN